MIEDKLSFAHRLIRWLQERGHTVYGYLGVHSVVENVLTASDVISETTPYELDLSTVDICFLDHYFEGEHYNGTSMTQLLVPFGIKVCGMSSVDPANFSMLRYGAVCAYRKDILAKILGL